MNQNYIKQNTVYQNGSYAILHKNLFFGKYKAMSNSARILYALLLERTGLSAQNHYFDRNGNAYIFFSREEAGKLLGLSERTVCKLFKELSFLNLIDDVPQGNKRANKIYVKLPEKCDIDEQKTKEKKQQRASMLRRKQETLKKLNKNIKVKQHTLQTLLHNLNEAKRQAMKKDLEKDLCYLSPDVKDGVKKQIDYAWWQENHQFFHVTMDCIDTVVMAVAELKTALKTKIADCYYSNDEIKEILQSLDSCFLMEFLDDFYQRTATRKIHNLKAYLKTCLVNFLQNRLIQLDAVPYLFSKNKLGLGKQPYYSCNINA